VQQQRFDLPPRLFIYFKPKIRVVQAQKSLDKKFVPTGELWLCEIKTGNGIVYKFQRDKVYFFGETYVELPSGYYWSGFTKPDKTQAERIAFTFSPIQGPEKSNPLFFYEDHISRIQDLANSSYIYQHLDPNPSK